jgi:hypothetical protein
MVLKKQIANNSPIQLKKKATEMKVLQKWNKKLLRACIPHLVYIGNEQNKEWLCYGSHASWQSAQNEKDYINHTQSNNILGLLWFQKKRWKCEIPIGSNVKLSRVMAAILNFRSANDSQV